MVFVDSHVHIHDGFNLNALFGASWHNVEAAWRAAGGGNSPQAVLMLTESAGSHWFERLCGWTKSGPHRAGDWTIHGTEEKCSLLLKQGNVGTIYLMAGRQIQTRERLEILALGILERFDEKLPILEGIARVRNAGGLPVLPWGFGKWTGKRGKIIDQLIDGAKEDSFFLGDNGCRPRILKEPHQFTVATRRGLRILRGSDPFPLPREHLRAGSYGFFFEGQLSGEKPAEDLKRRLNDTLFQISDYGRPQKLGRFISNQLLMQLKKKWTVH
jgi:hypothetical protein